MNNHLAIRTARRRIALLLTICLLFVWPASAAADPNLSSSPDPGASASSDPGPTASPEPTETAELPSSLGQLTLDATRVVYNGQTYQSGYVPADYPAPGGGQIMDIRLPLQWVTNGTVLTGSQIAIEPVASTDASVYPFEPNNVIQTGVLDATNKALITFPGMRVSSAAYNGTYPITFRATYRVPEAGLTEPVTGMADFRVFVKITGAQPMPTATPDTTPGSSGPSSVPKLMVSDYSTTPEKPMAAGNFDLSLTLHNTSKSSRIENIRVSVKSEDGKIRPLEGSGTSYIARIGADDTVQIEHSFTISGDTPAQPQPLTITMEYEDRQKNPVTMTETITVPVGQVARLVLDPPVVPSGVMDGDNFSISINLINMGKSTLYNVRAQVLGNGLQPEGSYFAGNMESGTSKTAEFSIYADLYAASQDTDEIIDPSDPGNAADPPAAIQPRDELTVLWEKEQSGETLSEEELAEKEKLEAEYYQQLEENQSDPIGETGEILPLNVAVPDVEVMPLPADGTDIKDGDGNILEEPLPAAQVNGRLLVTYEDEAGNESQLEEAFTLMIEPQQAYDPFPMPEEPEQQGGGWIVWLLIGLAAVAAVIIAIVLYRRHKKKEDDFDDFI